MPMRLQKTNNVSGDQSGFASIVIALVLIVILALLTVGFAQLARREQKSALDKQLSTQAFYAAESGINDALKDIQTGAITVANASSTRCMTDSTGAAGTTRTLPATALTAKSNVNPTNGVSYSCLLVNLTPSSLVFTGTQPGSGQYLSFSTTAPLSTLTIQWGRQDGVKSLGLSSSTYPTNAQLPPLATWNSASYPPLLQFSLTPTAPAPALVSRGALIDGTFTTYLYPANDTGSYTAGSPNNSTQVAMDLNNQGQIVPGNCGHDTSDTYPCSVTITGLGGVNSNYVMHYLDFYNAANVYISGTDASHNPVDFIGQVEVDVTGKAQNVLRRLHIRKNADGTNGNITNDTLRPDNALQAQDICKRLQTRPGNTDFVTSGGSPTTDPDDPCYLIAD
jgi:Tfp pilus assembly protein PilX